MVEENGRPEERERARNREGDCMGFSLILFECDYSSFEEFFNHCINKHVVFRCYFVVILRFFL